MKKTISLFLMLALVFALAVPALAAEEDGTQITQDGDSVTFYNPSYGYSLTLNGVVSYEDVDLWSYGTGVTKPERIYHLTDDGTATVTVQNIASEFDQFAYTLDNYIRNEASKSDQEYIPNAGPDGFLQLQQCDPGREVSWTFGSSRAASYYWQMGERDILSAFNWYEFSSMEEDPDNDGLYFYRNPYIIYFMTDGGRISFANRTVDGIPYADYIKAHKLAHASTQTVDLDGQNVEFQCYALMDDNGNPANYIKLRDLAMLLNGTAAQFDIEFNGSVNIVTKHAYDHPNGSEGSTPFSGDRTLTSLDNFINVDGEWNYMLSFVLTDDNGGGYTYYKLRDLGEALDFNVGWSADRGIFVETDKPYDPNN